MRLTILMLATGCVINVPPIAEQYNAQCVEAYLAHDLDQADVLCDHSLSFQDRYWDALNNKGLIALARGQTAEAKSFFIRAIRANQDMAQAYLNLAHIALDQADFTGAQDKCLAALRINPDYAEARHNLGLAYMRLNRLQDAEKTFRHLVVSAPGVSSGYASVGAVMLLEHRPKEAMTWFDHALQLEITYSDAWKGKGQAYELMGFETEAIESYSMCLENARGDLDCQRAIERLSD